ncbi:internalin I-like isoform X1 [Drosophila willistoni]|uniref:internalin I-like isoform X1 n=1 Tax=Drosophila willistoni TaxID=7260 RepID=UPI001F07148D|nr:internalin I-like isoform X1 [Drosophila willistoni]
MDNLSFQPHLETLTLNVRINVAELVECCKVNPNLRKLYIESNEIYGRLSDITLDNNSLQYLESLHFVMKPEIDAAEYERLSKLPKLNELAIDGTHQIGTLRPLFSGLAERKQLTQLLLWRVVVNDEESHAISQIKSLSRLECGFFEAKSIGHLSNLRSLYHLNITSQNDLASTLNGIVKILMTTRKELIKIEFYNAEITYEAFPICINISVRSTDISKFSVLSKVKNLNVLRICTTKKTKGSLQNLFNAFANGNLQSLTVQTNMFQNDRNAISAVASIKSLKRVICIFNDLSNIDVLARLPQLEVLVIIKNLLDKEQTDIESDTKINSKELKTLFAMIATKLSPKLNCFHLSPEFPIDYSVTSELITIKSLKSITCSFSDDESIKCLDKLPKLLYLKITSQHDFSKISEAIIKILSSSPIEFKMEKDSIDNSITWDPSKGLELNLIQGTDANRYASLGKLENCESLTVIGKCKLGSLHSLIRNLTLNQIQKLKELQLMNSPINYEETLMISQIKSLKHIICDFSDPRSYEVDFSHIDNMKASHYINENKSLSQMV